LPTSGWEFAEVGQFVPLAERDKHIANFQMQQRVARPLRVDTGNLTLPVTVHVQDQFGRHGRWFGVELAGHELGYDGEVCGHVSGIDTRSVCRAGIQPSEPHTVRLAH